MVIAAMGMGAIASAVPSSAATMNGGVSAGGTTVAIIPMGHLGDPANRFFQMFTQTAARWRPSTPVGVGTNGGIIVTAPAEGLVAVPPWGTSKLTAVSELVAGVQHNLANGEVLPPLVAGPSSIAADASSGVAAAITTSGTVLRWDRSDATPRRVGTTIGLAQTRAGRTCELRALTSVAVTSGGGLVVGGTCTKGGSLGLFERTPAGQWIAEGHLAGVAGSVIRLDAEGAGATGMIERGGSSPSLTTFMVAGPTAPGTLPGSAIPTSGHLGPSLSLHGRAVRSTELVQTGVGASPIPATNTYLVATIGGRTVRAWSLAPTMPVTSIGPALGRGTQAVIETASTGSASFGGLGITAFSVSAGTLRLSTLTPGATRWVPSATIRVAIPYGSAQ